MSTDPTEVEMIRAAIEIDFRMALDCGDAETLRQMVAAMAGRATALTHVVERAETAGVAAGRKQAAAEIRAFVERRGRFVTEFPPVTAEAIRRNDAVLGAYREAARIAEGGEPSA